MPLTHRRIRRGLVLRLVNVAVVAPDRRVEHAVREVPRVDERAGVIIDYTSFTITQSHLGDAYWDYTTPYQPMNGVGSMKVAGDANTGREDEHNPFRHHIRTIHTRDNDYAGVTVEKPDVQSMTQTADTGNYLTTDPVSVDVVEGETFGFYTLRLKSQPRKVPRQAGTNPNAQVITGAPGAARAGIDHTVGHAQGRRAAGTIRPPCS